MALSDLIKIPTVRAFLADGSVMTVFEAILEKFGLSVDRAEELLDLTDAILDGTLQLADIPALLQQAFGVEEERAKRMACDVVGFRLLPLEEYVPGVVAQLGEWGADMKKYPKSRVGKLKMLPETFAAKLSDTLRFEFSEVLIKRCGFLLGEYWFGGKTKDSTLTFFSRATTIGGLGLTPEQSQALLQEIENSRDMVELIAPKSSFEGEAVSSEVNSGEVALAEIAKNFHIDEEEQSIPEKDVETSSQTTMVEVAPSHEVATEVPIVNAPKEMLARVVPGVGRQKTEEEEDKWHAELKEAERKARQLIPSAPTAYDTAIAKALERAAPLLAEKKISETVFRDIIEKAVRGVRDLYQSRDMFARNLGLSGDALEHATEILEEAHKAVMLREERAPSVPVSLPVPQHDTLLDERFAAIAKDAPKTHGEETMPGARVSVARSVDEERRGQSESISKEKLIHAAVASRPPAVKPMLTVGSIAPNKRSQPMTDVQPIKRLMSPVDELGTMSPAEFRRLSSVPSDAVEKIEDILSTLQQQSYEDRVRGIAAWRKSPMNQLYVAMSTAALTQGVAVAEIAAKRRAAGEESLSPAEIRAVSGLNERLRF